MHLEWQQTWGDIVDTGTKLLLICEERLPSLPHQQQQRSGEVLQRVRQQLENDTANIRHQPHFWGTQLAQVAVRVAKRLPITDANRPIIGELANYCALVFDYRRKSDKSEQGSYEGLFRDSLQLFLNSKLPDLVPNVIAPDLLDEARTWLSRFYDKVPKDFSFVINDMILGGYETRRRELDKSETHGLMVRFVEDNKDLISLPVSEAREPTRTKWEDIYRNHVGEPPPPPGDRAISATLKARLKKAVQSNDPMVIRDIIAPAEPALVKTIKDALDVSFEFKEPRRTVQNYSHRPTAEFERARRQIRSGNQQAVSSFYEVWRGVPQNSVAKEWYAYSLAKIDEGWRQAKDLFEEVRDADRGDQITDWNLACCEVKLGNRPAAFATVARRVESGLYIDDVLEPAVSLALELGDKAFLGRHLQWLPLEEAVLLGYLYAADTNAEASELEEWLPAIEVIASSDKLFEPPHPAETVPPPVLNDLCFAFIRRRMVRGGITWFRRRVGFDEHKYFYLNWHLLGDLCVQDRDLEGAVSAFDQLLACTSRSTARPDVKAQTLGEVLNILEEQKCIDDAGQLLTKYSSLLPAPEVIRWQQRLQTTSPPPPPLPVGTPEPPVVLRPDERPMKVEDPQSRFMKAVLRLGKVRRLDDLKGDLSLISDGADALFEMWPAFSRKLTVQIHSAKQALEGFATTPNLDEKERLGGVLRDVLGEIAATMREIDQSQLKEQAEPLIGCLRRLAEDVSFQTKATRNIEIDSHVDSYLPSVTFQPVSPELPRTTLSLRIINRGSEPATAVRVSLQSESGQVKVVDSVLALDRTLEPGATAVLRFRLEYEELNGGQAFVAYATFAAGGVTNLQTPPQRFVVGTAIFNERLNGADIIQDRFFVGLGIPDDRRDVFHGREREQRRIANSVQGSVQSEVLFLNGPRRVGKTSILNSLRWALPELGMHEIITVPLAEEIPRTTAAFLRGIALEVAKAVDAHLGVQAFLQVPPPEAFEPEPSVTFREFCDTAQQALAPRRILLMVDETQRLAQAIKSGRIDDNVLGLFSTLMSRNSGIVFVFTASVLFRNVKDLSPHPIWGRVTQYATGFLSADAVTRVLQAGVAPYPVKFTSEAVQRVWEMTEGHPWVVQAIGKRIVSEVLNPQQRLTVVPADVDQAVEFIEKLEDQYSYYWWNERPEEGGFVDETDWELARLVIEKQERERTGIPKGVAFEEMKRRGGAVNNERINKLVDMQTMVKETREGEEYVRIKGLFLERWLRDQILMRRSVGKKATAGDDVAVFVDHENVAISMQQFVEELPGAQQASWMELRGSSMLARRLAQQAARHGKVVSRIAVANWPLFAQDLTAYAHAMFDFSQPLGGKNTSDERLKQLIRDTLENNPDVETYVIGTGDADFRDTVQTLLKRNKRVVLWGFRAIGTLRSNVSNVFKEMETWQNVTIEYLDDILLREVV